MSNERIEFIEKPALINNQARLLYVSSSKYEGDCILSYTPITLLNYFM